MRLQDAQHTDVSTVKAVINWIAAVLGIGTFAGLVNVTVGILSATWLCYQLYVAIKYDLPVKRAKLEAAKRNLLESTQPGEL